MDNFIKKKTTSRAVSAGAVVSDDAASEAPGMVTRRESRIASAAPAVVPHVAIDVTPDIIEDQSDLQGEALMATNTFATLSDMGSAEAAIASASAADVDDEMDPFYFKKIKEICSSNITEENHIKKINDYLLEIGITGDINTIYTIITSSENIAWDSILPRINKETTFYNSFLKEKQIQLSDFTIMAEGTNNRAYNVSINSTKIPEAILRVSRHKTFYSFRNAVYENLKHIFLYLINRCNIGKKYQLVPQPLFCGYYINDDGDFELFFLMEKGENTLGNVIRSYLPSIFTGSDVDNLKKIKKSIRKLIYSYYNSLFLLNKHTEYFIHGDSKYNNAIIKNNKIMLIDFGYSSFKFYDFVFKSPLSSSVYYSKNNTNLNNVQDLIQMLLSFCILIYKFAVEQNTNFGYNENYVNNYMLDKMSLIINVPSSKFIGYKLFIYEVLMYLQPFKEYPSMWQLFYNTNYNNFSYPIDSINYISPAKMKKHYKITETTNLLFNEFTYQKYLKIKNNV